MLNLNIITQWTTEQVFQFLHINTLIITALKHAASHCM